MISVLGFGTGGSGTDAIPVEWEDVIAKDVDEAGESTNSSRKPGGVEGFTEYSRAVISDSHLVI